jgi:RNA polymerase sigma-70 factor (ECF subfamily)
MSALTAASEDPAFGGAKAPDADDFVLLALPHVAAMTRLAARMCGAGEADDIVQEALIRAWRKRSRFDAKRGTLLGWLLAVTADQARRWRVRAYRPTAELRDVPAPTAGDDLDLEIAIERLPRRQRHAIDLYYFVGLSTAETAEAMRCSEGTVKSTLSDARGGLRGFLEGRNG